MYRSQGIEPCEMKFVVVKSPLGLRTEYEPISKAIISVDTPGCCRADLTQLPFKRIPRPMFPFDDLNDIHFI
jgi:microcystin degradation protein MlrC